MSKDQLTLKPTRMRTHPHTTRSRLMLEVASALVNRRDWNLLQARVSLREQGADGWPLTLFGSDSPAMAHLLGAFGYVPVIESKHHAWYLRTDAPPELSRRMRDWVPRDTVPKNTAA